jgi:site-specific recombinase XerD
MKDKTTATASILKAKLQGTDQRARMLAPIFQDHNNKVETLMDQEFAPGTLERYKTSLKHTIEFLQWKYSVSDIDIKNIDHSFITGYELFLRSVRKCANNTAVKYIKNFKKIIKICISNGWLDPEELILKYADHPQCINEDKLLPVLTNQKMNSYLKEIADVCGINKELTFHIARHTFATTVTLTNGVPIESASKILGHKSIKTT